MPRLLLIAAVIALLFWAVRRALGAGPRPSRRGGGRVRVGRRDGSALGPPDQLVCGECGAQFDAEKHAWICPHCKR